MRRFGNRHIWDLGFRPLAGHLGFCKGSLEDFLWDLSVAQHEGFGGLFAEFFWPTFVILLSAKINNHNHDGFIIFGGLFYSKATQGPSIGALSESRHGVASHVMTDVIMLKTFHSIS